MWQGTDDMNRVPVNPELLTWARERAGLDALALAGRLPKLIEWEDGELQPTLRQVENSARAVHVPIGYLFLPAPPDEPLPIPDFRTLAGRDVVRPSLSLLDANVFIQAENLHYGLDFCLGLLSSGRLQIAGADRFLENAL